MTNLISKWLVLVGFLNGFPATISSVNEQAVQSGKFQFELIQRDSQMPRFGNCWTKALEDLKSGCQSLTDESQSRMALQFANCFLNQAGQKTYECQTSQSVSDCLTGVDSNAFSAYTNFFTHTHNMCQFLQHQIWHKESQSAMQGLTKTSSKVVETLKSSSKLQDDIIKNQMETLQFQKQIAEHGFTLSQSVEQSRLSAKEMMAELRSSTDEQKTLIFSIFDRVTKLQSLLLSEVSWLYTVLFYAGCLLAVYLATATKRTADARLWLFILISINVGIERLICSWTVTKAELDPFIVFQNDDSTPEALLHYRIWIARKVTLFLSVIVLAYQILTFQDINVINNQLLRDIQKQNADLCRTVQFLKSGASTTFVSEAPKDVTDSQEADDEASDDDEDNISFDSKMTDTTWKLDDFSDEDTDVIDDDSFDTAQTTPVAANNNDKSPNVTEIVPVNYEVMNSFDTSLDIKPKKKGRPPGSRNTSRSSTPVIGNHSYNLRKRSNCSIMNNSVVNTESPDTFARIISGLAQTSRENRREVTRLNKSTLAVISDDE